MLILNAEQTRRALPMRDVVEAMKQAFAALSAKRAVVPLRAHIEVEAHEGVCLVMPAYLRDDDEPALAVKVVTLFGGNLARGLPRIQAAVLALEPETGRPAALLEGGTLTAIRTGAASGAATDLLARHDSTTVAIFGSGVQARTQLEAVCAVRAIQTAWIYSPNAEHAERMIAELSGRAGFPRDLRRAETPAQALANADIVCAATTSKRPVFEDADLRPGTHVNAVGSYQPHVQEIPAETVVRARVVVDSRSAALAETGDLIQPRDAGLWDPASIHAELGEIVLGERPGREDERQITLFESVGSGVQDAAAVRLALRQAERQGLGQRVEW